MKPGPRPLPESVMEQRGTARPSRPRETVVDEVSGAIHCPDFVKGKARKLFWERVAVYKARGQNIGGCERIIGHYVLLDLDITDRRRARQPVTASELNALTKFASMFYDASSVQVESGRKSKGGNPFDAHGKPPKPTSV